MDKGKKGLFFREGLYDRRGAALANRIEKQGQGTGSIMFSLMQASVQAKKMNEEVKVQAYKQGYERGMEEYKAYMDSLYTPFAPALPDPCIQELDDDDAQFQGTHLVTVPAKILRMRGRVTERAFGTNKDAYDDACKLFKYSGSYNKFNKDLRGGEVLCEDVRYVSQ